MGYGKSECIVCYCGCGGNNATNIIQMNVCKKCFMKYCPNGLRGRACDSSYVTITRTHCDVCDTYDTICLTHVAVCIKHMKNMNPITDVSGRRMFHPENDDIECKYDARDEFSRDFGSYYYETDTCDGDCGCPNCPEWKQKNLESFCN